MFLYFLLSGHRIVLQAGRKVVTLVGTVDAIQNRRAEVLSSWSQFKQVGLVLTCLYLQRQAKKKIRVVLIDPHCKFSCTFGSILPLAARALLCIVICSHPNHMVGCR